MQRKKDTSFKDKMTSGEKKLASVLLLLIVGFAGIGTAAWVLTFESGITGYVIGGVDGEIIFSDDFEMTEENSSYAFSKIEAIDIINNDGLINATIEINTTITNEADECSNAGDVDVIVEYLGNVISDGDTIEIPSGSSNITVETSAVERSCPQRVESFVILTA